MNDDLFHSVSLPTYLNVDMESRLLEFRRKPWFYSTDMLDVAAFEVRPFALRGALDGFKFMFSHTGCAISLTC